MNLLRSLKPAVKYRWFPLDALMVIDVLLNVVHHEWYQAIGSWLNVEPSAVNSVISVLEMARFAVLAHKARG